MELIPRWTLSARLWHVLFQSLPRHPLFWLPLSATTPDPDERKHLLSNRRYWRWAANGFFVAIAIVVVLLALPLVILLLSLLFVMLLNGGTIAGLVIAVGTSDRIAREISARRIDVLAVTPVGLIGTHWLIAMQHLRWSSTAVNVRRLVETLYVALTLLVPFCALFGLIGFVDDTTWAWVLIVLLIGCAIWMDYGQSLVTAVLIGISAPALSSARTDADVAALGGFIGLQIAVYVVGLVTMAIMGGVFEVFGWTSTPSLALLTLLRVAFFVALREAVIVVLWRWQLDRFNALPAELSEIAGKPV